MPRELAHPGTLASDRIRTLPVSVLPVDGETPESYLLRLATANALPPETLWAHLRKLDGKLPFKRHAELVTPELEALGDLQQGWFGSNRFHHLLPVRCPHSNWRLRQCDLCSQVPKAQSGCLRCSHGQPTQTTTRTGPVCLHHRRWHHHDINLDVSDLPAYLNAEKQLRFTLWPRGVGLETGELQLAGKLLEDWADGAQSRAPQHRERILDRLTGTTANRDQERFIIAFPDMVKLTLTLTDPRFTALLLSPRWSPSQHAYLLSTAVASIAGTPLSDRTIEDLWRTVNSGARAIDAAYGMIGTRRTSRRCARQRAFASAAYTHRACLLRHLDAKDMPHIRAPKSGPAAPSPRTLTKYQERNP